MEIKLNGIEAGIVMGTVVVEAVIGFSALRRLRKVSKKANEKAFEAAIYKFSDYVKDIRIKQLEKENTALRFGRKK